MRAVDPATLARLALLAAILAISNPNTLPPAAGTSETVYVVQAGDTLFSIAAKFKVTVQAIQQANNLTDPNALAVGQRLKIPKTSAAATAVVTPTPTARGPTATLSSTTASYTVKAGDTLASIAQQFGVTVQALAQANGIKNVNVLSVGQVLIIPEPTPAVTNTPAPTPTPLPNGVAITPGIIKQGTTLEIKITAAEIVSATGKFDQQTLRFVANGDALIARVGITRCANYTGTFPVKLALQDAPGNAKPLSFDLRVNATDYPIFNLTLTPQMSALLDPAIVNAENKRVADTVSPFTPEKLWNGAFRSPLAVKNPRVSANFGERRRYNGGNPGQCGHEGTDYAVDGGTPVYAPASAIVALAAKLQVRGNVVLLDHGQGVYSGFYHLSALDVKTGQRVQPGDLIAKVGTTGFSTGDHLHWSLWVNGVYVDPGEWMAREIK